MLNLEQIVGFQNRHIVPLPTEPAIIKIIHGEHAEIVLLCEWIPFKKENYSEINMPSDAYLGTANVIAGKLKGKGIGSFHAWSVNNDEFVYYSVVPLTLKQ
jgi:hypothetical protein